jgi:hypothetical protein
MRYQGYFHEPSWDIVDFNVILTFSNLTSVKHRRFREKYWSRVEIYRLNTRSLISCGLDSKAHYFRSILRGAERNYR